jgi:PhnB protein
VSFHPYLFFGGNCRDAFTRYQEVFGGELVLIRGGDMPEGDRMPGDPELIAHAALTIGEDLLMGSDDPLADPFGPVQGMQVNYDAPDAVRATSVFEGLADGGVVHAPLGPVSFSELFGMCVDRFGTPWMITVAAPADAG